MKTKKKSIFLYYFMIFVLSSALLLVFSHSTSPLYSVFGNDSLEYKMGGAAVLDGLVIFRDIFHQKGAVLFFIEAIGEALCRLIGDERFGTFIVQLINFFITNCFIFNYTKKYIYQSNNDSIPKCYSYIIPVATILFWLSSIDGGNLTEEYAILYCIISIGIALDYSSKLDKKNGELPEFHSRYGFIFGICLAFACSLKPNCAIPIAACILFVFVVLVINKRFASIFKNIVTGIAGMAVVFVPILLYYYKNNALDDLFEQTVIFNFKYIVDTKTLITAHDFKHTIMWGGAIASITFLSIMCVFISKKKYTASLSAVVCVTSAVMYIIIGVAWPQYMQLEAPALFVLLCALCNVSKKKLSKFFVIAILAVAVLFSSARQLNYIVKRYNAGFKENNLVVTQKIDSFYNGVNGIIDDSSNRQIVFVMSEAEKRYAYYHFRQYPFSSYFALEFYTRHNNQDYLNKFKNDFENNPPRYVAVLADYKNNDELYSYYSIVIDSLDDNYHEIFRDNNYILLEAN